MNTPYLQSGHSSAMGFSSWALQKKGVCGLCQMLTVQPCPQSLPVLASAHIPHLIFYLLKGNGSTFSHLIFNGHITGFGTPLVSLARLWILEGRNVDSSIFYSSHVPVIGWAHNSYLLNGWLYLSAYSFFPYKVKKWRKYLFQKLCSHCQSILSV